MSMQALQDYVFTAKYSRYLPEKQRRETFSEAVQRVIDMHRQHFTAKGIDIEDLLEEVQQAILNKTVLGSQRAMQFGGEPILNKHARLYNCTTTYCDRPRVFQETLWLLLCGCGVGFSVQHQHVNMLPKVQRPRGLGVEYIIEDSIEGWADALGALLSSYFITDQPFKKYYNKIIHFNYDNIRPRGAAISSGVGRAPGPEPLKRSLNLINEVLKDRTAHGPIALRPIDVYDIMCHASDAVISGGVRRSALICLFSADDAEMAEAKTGNWFSENPQRARSNNSVMLLRNSTSKEVFTALMHNVKEFGEPGFIWTDDLEATFNPCVTGDTLVETDKGQIKIANLINKEKEYLIKSFNEHTKEYELKPLKNAFKTKQNANIIQLEFDDNTFLKCTPDHKILTANRGYVEAALLTENDEILCKFFDALCLDEPEMETAASIKTKRIKRITVVQNEDVYDITVADNHNFLANGTVVHNCCEIGLYPRIDGQSGFAFCNLCEINMGKVKSLDDFLKAARAAAILGTLQADYTTFTYLGEVSEKIAKREALLGVSMTGMMEQPDIAFNAEYQRKAAQEVLRVNELVANRIGINLAARATTVKPSGTSSCILGTSSGIHPHHAKHYFRRAQANITEAPAKFYAEHNPDAAEKSVWNPNGTDIVLTFCITAGEESITKKYVNAVGLLRHVKLTKQNWIDYGKRTELCIKPWLSHNVSNTISVRDSEWSDVTDYIFDNRQFFTGISLLSEGGDLDYAQAPFCKVLTLTEIVDKYGAGALIASGLIVAGLESFNDNLWLACDAVLGRTVENYDCDTALTIEENTHPDIAQSMQAVFERQKQWIYRAKKFAHNYFNDDVLEMTRCLKHVNNRKLWEDLHRKYVTVDYTQMIEEVDNTTLLDTVACAGGACEII